MKTIDLLDIDNILSKNYEKIICSNSFETKNTPSGVPRTFVAFNIYKKKKKLTS